MMIYEEHLNFHNLSYMIARAKPGLTIHLLYASVCVCVYVCVLQKHVRVTRINFLQL